MGMDDGVVNGVEVVRQQEVAVTLAVVSIVAVQCHNPVVPVHVAKVQVKRVALAHVLVTLFRLLPLLLLVPPVAPIAACFSLIPHDSSSSFLFSVSAPLGM